METKDWRAILSWHLSDVLEESGVLNGIGDVIVELCDAGIETVVGLEDCLLDPKLSIGFEHVSVQIVRDPSTILHLAHHVLHSFPGIGNAQNLCGEGTPN